MRANQTYKLKMKFYAFSAVLVFSLLFTVIYSLILMGIINTGTTEISGTWLPSVIIAEELNTATANFRIAEMRHAISKDASIREGYENTLHAVSDQIEDMFVQYETSYIKDDIDLSLITQARNLWSGYLLVHERMMSYSLDNDSDIAMNILQNESELVFNEVAKVFQRLVTFNTEGAEAADLKSDNLYQSTYFVLVFVILIAFGITFQFRNLMQEIEKTQKDLEHSNEEALLSSKAKSNFLANMSHEIRTPMNAISGMIDIILRETEDKSVVEYAHNIKRACDSLLFIINDVLDISKIESGKLDIVEAEYSLSDVLNDVLTIANSRLEHKDLMFITNFQQNLPETIIGDEVRVKQVMVNILNNAIKFTEKGHIAFNVIGSYANGELKLEFQIVDTGVGISEDNIEKLFEEFERVDTKKNRNIEGTGLGLAISKRLAEMMGGGIEVESLLGKGTTFKVYVLQKYKNYTPIAQIETQKSVLIFESRELYRYSIREACEQLSLKKVVVCTLQSELNEALVEEKINFVFTTALYQHKIQEIIDINNLSTKIVILVDNLEAKTKFDNTTLVLPLPVNSVSIANLLNGKTVDRHTDNFDKFIAPECKVLVVDDNNVNLIVAQGLMKPYKFSIDTAMNGQEAVDKIKENKYDMVFMDHMMPVLDGIDATIMVRSLIGDYYQNLPIIALTANAIVGTQEMFIDQGMSDFLGKPIKVEKLNDILRKWLPRNMQVAIDDIEVEESDENSSEVKIKIPEVDIQLGIQRIGGGFDDYINILTHYRKDGVKKLPVINEFFQNKAFNDYKIEVHAIKSASASLGAMEVSQKAGFLEDACTASDLAYIAQNHQGFVEKFDDLLKNIAIALEEFIQDEEDIEKSEGSNEKLIEILTKLKDALDFIDLVSCEELLNEINSYNWTESTIENINKIKESVDEYEYDDALEVIESML